MVSELEMILAIGTLIGGGASVVLAVVAVMELRAARNYRRDLETSRKMLEELQKEVSRAELQRRDKELQWKMFTDAGKLFLNAYKAGFFEGDEYEE